jgi:periplasmic protein TonB
MAEVSEMIRTGIVELRSSAGSFYARPSFWERLYLVWTFRNFHALPKEVLNPRQQRLAEKLCHGVDFTLRGPIIRFPIIGVIENAAPVPIAKAQVLPAANNVVEMTASRAELDMPRAVAAGETSLRAANPGQNQPFLGTLARYAANVVKLPPAKQKPTEPGNNDEPGLALSDPQTAIYGVRRNLRWVLVAGCVLAALGLVGYVRSGRHAAAAKVQSPAETAPRTPVPAALPAQPGTVPPSPRLTAKRSAVRPTPSEPVELAAAKQEESQPSSSIIHVLPAVPDADSSTPASTAAPAASARAAAPTATGVTPPAITAPVRSERLHIAEPPESGIKYPVAADRSLTGKVSLKAVIGEDGAVREVDVLSGNRALAEAAARAVKRWRYHPYELNGRAVEAEALINFSFLGDDVVSISFSR